ncbi:MAG TPA: hypothetical protein VLC28_02730 [Flavitalea sp.]|nr:hypothetical protein [Flavitalea sp.]
MKKLLLSIFALIYLANVSGATLRLHYCMGKLVRIGVTADAQQQCGHCGMKKTESAKKHCCKDEEKKVSSEKQLKAVVASMQYLKAPQSLIKPFQSVLVPDALILSRATTFPVSNAPPSEEDLFILFNVFRI